MNLEKSEVVYQDEERVVYGEQGKFYEGMLVDGEVNLREIDGYQLKHFADGSTEWAGAVIKSSPIHVTLVRP